MSDPTATRMPTTAEILGWDVGTWSVALDAWRPYIESVGTTLDCLEVGAGPGGPSLWMASHGHEVTCTNRSDSRALASPLHEQFSQSSRISYHDIDVTDIPWRDRFDVVVFKSVIGGVQPLGREGRSRALGEIRRALRPGGVLLYAENVRATALHGLARAAARRRRSGPWHYPTLAELESELSEFSVHTLETTGVLAMFGLTEGQRRLFTRVDRRVLNRLPPSWRYVAYGAAST